VNLRVRRPDAPHAANALRQPRRRPRQIEMHHDRCILEIQPFAQQVCRDQQVDAFRSRDGASAAGGRSKAREDLRPRELATCDPGAVCGHGSNASVDSEAGEHRVHGIRELREHDDPLGGVPAS
jgi:hypothetical protein